MTKSLQKNVPDVGIELGADGMPSGHASDRATCTAPGYLIHFYLIIYLFYLFIYLFIYFWQKQHLFIKITDFLHFIKTLFHSFNAFSLKRKQEN